MPQRRQSRISYASALLVLSQALLGECGRICIRTAAPPPNNANTFVNRGPIFASQIDPASVSFDGNLLCLIRLLSKDAYGLVKLNDLKGDASSRPPDLIDTIDKYMTFAPYRPRVGEGQEDDNSFEVVSDHHQKLIIHNVFMDENKIPTHKQDMNPWSRFKDHKLRYIKYDTPLPNVWKVNSLSHDGPLEPPALPIKFNMWNEAMNMILEGQPVRLNTFNPNHKAYFCKKEDEQKKLLYLIGNNNPPHDLNCTSGEFHLWYIPTPEDRLKQEKSCLEMVDERANLIIDMKVANEEHDRGRITPEHYERIVKKDSASWKYLKEKFLRQRCSKFASVVLKYNQQENMIKPLKPTDPSTAPGSQAPVIRSEQTPPVQQHDVSPVVRSPAVRGSEDQNQRLAAQQRSPQVLQSQGNDQKSRIDPLVPPKDETQLRQFGDALRNQFEDPQGELDVDRFLQHMGGGPSYRTPMMSNGRNIAAPPYQDVQRINDPNARYKAPPPSFNSLEPVPPVAGNGFGEDNWDRKNPYISRALERAQLQQYKLVEGFRKTMLPGGHQENALVACMDDDGELQMDMVHKSWHNRRVPHGTRDWELQHFLEQRAEWGIITESERREAYFPQYTSFGNSYDGVASNEKKDGEHSSYAPAGTLANVARQDNTEIDHFLNPLHSPRHPDNPTAVHHRNGQEGFYSPPPPFNFGDDYPDFEGFKGLTSGEDNYGNMQEEDLSKRKKGDQSGEVTWTNTGKSWGGPRGGNDDANDIGRREENEYDQGFRQEEQPEGDRKKQKKERGEEDVA